MATTWKECHLGDVVTLKRGYDLPKSRRKPGSVPIVSSSGTTDFHAESKVSGPGVVTGRYGTLGEVFYVEEDFWPLNTSLYVEDFKGNHPRFIKYFLSTLSFAAQNAAGAVPGVNRNALHLMEVRCPDPKTQRRIASILGAYDDLIENNLRRIRILEEMAQRLYREWFVHFRFPGHHNTPMTDSPLGPIPEGWEVKSVTEAVEVKPKTKVSKGGEKTYVPMGGLSTDSMLITDFETRTGNNGSKFKNGDTLFARITPCLENGKTGFVQFLPNDDAVAIGSTEFIVLRSRTVTPEYVYLMARSDEFRDNAIKSMTGATGRQRVQEACFGKFLIAQPDPETLQAFSQATEPTFAFVKNLAARNDFLRETRDLLLPRLISGEQNIEDAMSHA